MRYGGARRLNMKRFGSNSGLDDSGYNPLLLFVEFTISE